MAVQIEMRRDLAANWTASNPILTDGEWGKETDTNKWKNGDGVTAWNALAYTIPSGGSGSVQPTSAQFSALSAHVELVSNAVSVVSNALSVETAARVVAVNTVSNALSNETSNRLSADVALSTAINVVSNAVSNEASVRAVSVQTASAAATSVDGRVTSVNAFLSGISARSVGDVSTHGLQSVINALSNRISAGGGTGSVTSAEVVSLVQIASAAATSADAHANTASAAATSADAHAATASAAATSADAHANTVSARVVSVSAELASLVQIASAAATSADAHAATASAAATSADAHANTVSARVVSVSAELASLIQIASAAATSADGHANTVSARVVSVSAELASLVQIASAAATSADAHAATASAAATSADAHANTVSARVVSVSAELVSLVQIASAAATSADAHANTVSARVVSVSAELASLVQIASAAATSADAHANAASAAATSVLNFVQGVSAQSVGGTSVKGLQSVVNALSNRISAGGGTGSVTSAKVASVDARVTSVNVALSAISARSVGDISTHGLQSVVNALSNRVSIATGLVGILAVTNVGSTFTSLASGTLSLSANGIYEIHAMFIVSATTGQPYAMGIGQMSGISIAVGFWRAAISVGVGGSIAAITTQAVFAQWNNNVPGFAVSAFTCTRGATASQMPVSFDGLFILGASDSKLVFECGTSTGQTFAVYPGSYVRAIRVGTAT